MIECMPTLFHYEGVLSIARIHVFTHSRILRLRLRCIYNRHLGHRCPITIDISPIVPVISVNCWTYYLQLHGNKKLNNFPLLIGAV